MTHFQFCFSSFSTGSMSSPALWASESFTQGLRSMEEVRLLRNMTLPTSCCLPEDCFFYSLEYIITNVSLWVHLLSKNVRGNERLFVFVQIGVYLFICVQSLPTVDTHIHSQGSLRLHQEMQLNSEKRLSLSK